MQLLDSYEYDLLPEQSQGKPKTSMTFWVTCKRARWTNRSLVIILIRSRYMQQLSMATFNDLPLQLLPDIMQGVAMLEDLVPCCLVSKTFCAQARSFLYYAIVVSPSHSEEKVTQRRQNSWCGHVSHVVTEASQPFWHLVVFPGNSTARSETR